MGNRSFFLGLTALLLVGLPFAACGVTVTSGNNGGGAGGAGGTAVTGPATVTATTGTVTETAGTGSDVGATTSVGSGASCPPSPPPTGPCAPQAPCAGVGSQCLSEVDQAGASTFGLRMSHLLFTAPPAFTSGLVSVTLESSAAPDQPSCNLHGPATFSWLLLFDLAAGTVTTGGAKPSMSAAGPYQFVDEMVNGAHVAPVTLGAPLSPACGFASSAGDLVLPIYLDSGATQVVLLPMHQMRFHDGAVSADHGCIGHFNAEALDPANACTGDKWQPTFVDGAAVDGFLALAETDLIVVGALQETLCVVLTGDAVTYGTKNAENLTVCKRDASNQILFHGDWCSATNQPASGGCADAVRLSATFAAQGVLIQ